MRLSRRQHIALIAMASLMVMLLPTSTSAATIAERVAGRILLDVQNNGEAWYVSPTSLQRYSLGRPQEALAVMSSLGLGISNENLAKIPEEGSNEPGYDGLRRQLSGKILLQVEENGEAWYVYPVDTHRYFLGRPADALRVMRELGLGISSANLATIPLADGENFSGDTTVQEDISIATARGSFTIDLVTLDKSKFDFVTDTASLTDCNDNCPAKSLATYVAENSGVIGIHGTYFCPPDYASCQSKTNTFNPPVFNSAADAMINESKLPFHAGPMITQDSSDTVRFFHRTEDFGNSVSGFENRTGVELRAALANYPSLMENGQNIVSSEPLETPMLNKATRGGIGYSDERWFLVIARSATVIDLASIFEALGAKWALNLDGGGSAALYAFGNYLSGPGRLLPNAIIFRAR